MPDHFALRVQEEVARVPHPGTNDGTPLQLNICEGCSRCQQGVAVALADPLQVVSCKLAHLRTPQLALAHHLHAQACTEGTRRAAL